MSNNLTISYGFIKQIAFINGQVLEDYHLHMMQTNFSDALKHKSVRDRYDTLLLVSPYNYYFMESFIDNADRHSSSTAVRDALSYCVRQGDWITPFLQLPSGAEEICMYASFEDNQALSANVKFYIRTVEEGFWQEARVDYPVKLPKNTRNIQIKAVCSYFGTVRPELYDFAMFVKQGE